MRQVDRRRDPRGRCSAAASAGRHPGGEPGGDSDAGRKTLGGESGSRSESPVTEAATVARGSPMAAGEYPGGLSGVGGVDRGTMGSQGDSLRREGGSLLPVGGGAAPHAGN